jgi:anti-anti-sigma regulatory factor
MREIQIAVEPMPDHAAFLVRPVGALTMGNRHRLRSAVLKCLAECPAAVVIDLSDCELADRLAAVVFVALRWEAAAGAAVNVLLCGAAGAMAQRIQALAAGQPSYQTLRQATDAIAQDPPPPTWRRQRFTAAPESTSLAGCLVTDACIDWRRPDLVHPGRAVMFDLVHDAYLCAPSELRIIVSQRAGVLALSVRSHVPDGHFDACTLDREPQRRTATLPTTQKVTYYRTATMNDHLNWALISTGTA